MGIRGAPNILTYFKRGLYHKHAKRYAISVDGELMRYKGMIESNCCKHNAEEAIAASSVDYLRNKIDNIEKLIGRRAEYIIVYMDGIRVNNKVTNRPDFAFDANLIRTVFKVLCLERGYRIHELEHGESELQMYLRRDQNLELNVFLTNDSDMLSICYGHKSKISEIEFDFTTDFVPQQNHTLGAATDGIFDGNYIYPDTIKVLDSCVWINSGRAAVTAIGFDGCEDRLCYNQKVFRSFVAFCGTDFTSSLLTDSMINGVMSAEHEDREYINTLENINEIGASILLLGIRAGGSIKRATSANVANQFCANGIAKSVSMYIDYISSGVMGIDKIPHQNMSVVCREYLYAMKNQDDTFVKKALIMWAQKTKLPEAIENLRKYLGTYGTSVQLKNNARKRIATVIDVLEVEEKKIKSQ